MKISLAILFLVLVTVTQLGATNILSKRDTQEALLSDGTENNVQNGSDIIMVNPGSLDIVLTEEDKLDFEVCSSTCTADFLVCYEADSPGQNVLHQCDTKCGFFVTTRGDDISFMTPISERFPGIPKLDQCFQATMKNGITSVLANKQIVAQPITCKPKIENGIMKLTIVNASSECPVSIKNAILKPDPTTAAPTTLGQFAGTSTTRGNGSATTDDETESFIGNYWWIFLVLGILIVVVIVGIGIYCCIRRRKSKKAKKAVAPPRDEKSVRPASAGLSLAWPEAGKA